MHHPRHCGIAIAAALLAAGFAEVGHTGKTDFAFGHVYVDVTPHISVQPIPQTPDQIADVMPGSSFPVIARFNIAANTDRVEMGCVVTGLHRAAVASSVDRIPVKKSAGCVIDAVHANPVNGASTRAVYQNEVTVDLSGFPAYPTNMISFQSFQTARFNMDVSLVARYEIARLNMPQGQYGGIIKLVALISE